MIQISMRVSQLLPLGILASWLAGMTACSSHQQPENASPEVVRDVVVLQVQKTRVPDYVEATGTVRAARSAQLASQVMGVITRVKVHEGDRVRRGEVLITISAAQQRSAYDSASAGLSASQQAIAAANADYALAEATMKRYQMLYDKKSLSPQEYDEVKTQFAAATARRDEAHAGQAQAEAALSEADSAVGFTSICAPFDGLIIAKLVDTGAMAAPGVPLLALEDPSRFRLEALVDESQIGTVRIGEMVPVVLDSLGNQTITGKVVQIVPTADPASRTFTVKVELSVSPQIHSGLFGRARFVRGERDPILVPQNALVHRGQLDAVYVVGQDEIATLRYVTVGKPYSAQIEALSGLENRERIVAQPNERELSGKQVRVK